MDMRFSRLRRSPVVAGTSTIGRIADLYFDDRTWRVTDVVVEGGRRSRAHRTLIEAEAVTLEDHRGVVTARAPAEGYRRDADTVLPVSDQMELRYHDYMRWMMYWINGFAVPYTSDTRMWMDESDIGDAHLRSAAAVLGHHVLARDGDAGSVADFMIDPENWYMLDLVVHYGVWPHASDGYVSPFWVSGVSWARSCVDVVLPRDRVRYNSLA